MEDLILLKQNRIASRISHQRWARFWFILLILCNGLIGFTGFIGIYISVMHHLLIIFVIIFAIIWGITSEVRRKASYHYRLVRGFEQPYAEELLVELIEENKPFALYLRGFDLERENIQYKGINEDADLSDSTLEARAFESLLIRTLNIPILALNDPRFNQPLEGVHRFYKVPDDWYNYVAALADKASMIFLYISIASPGITDEIKLIKNSKAEKKTITVLSKNSEIRDDGFYAGRLLKEHTDKKWSRRIEKKFQQLFLIEVQTLLENQNLNSNILNSNQKFKLTTPGPLLKSYRYIKGPLLASSVLLIFMLIMETNAVVNHALDRTKAINDTYEMILWVPLALAILIILKSIYVSIQYSKNKYLKSIQQKAYENGRKMGENMFKY